MNTVSFRAIEPDHFRYEMIEGAEGETSSDNCTHIDFVFKMQSICSQDNARQTQSALTGICSDASVVCPGPFMYRAVVPLWNWTLTASLRNRPSAIWAAAKSPDCEAVKEFSNRWLMLRNNKCISGPGLRHRSENIVCVKELGLEFGSRFIATHWETITCIFCK